MPMFFVCFFNFFIIFICQNFVMKELFLFARDRKKDKINKLHKIYRVHLGFERDEDNVPFY